MVYFQLACITCLHLRDNKDNELTDSDKLQERWKECIDYLCDKSNKSQEEEIHLETDLEEDGKGPPILFSEFEAALGELKMERQKERMDTSRTVKSSLSAKGERELYDICSEIYFSGEWPDDILDSVIFPIEKKHGAQYGVYFRTISLLLHASNIVLKIFNLQARIYCIVVPRKGSVWF